MSRNNRSTFPSPSNPDDILLYYNTVRYILPPDEDKPIEVSSAQNNAMDISSHSPKAGVTSVASVALEAEIDDCQQRMLSGEILMSRAATEHKGAWTANSREVAVRPFLEAFHAEMKRLAAVVENGWLTTESSVEALLKDVNGISRRKELGTVAGPALKKELDSLKRQAKDLQNRTIKKIRDNTKTQKELQRIALKADSKLRTACVDECEREFSKTPWSDDCSSGHIVKLISDIFSLVRKIEKEASEKDGKWVAPQTFERVTTKYWVQEEDLPEVLLKSASELPVLVYGKSGLLTKNPKLPSESKTNFWKAMGTNISSVYFDSDNLDLYRERIKRSEGAQLVRCRWYGKNKPKSDSLVFLELKTHHESWIDNKSVKERVNVLERRMNDLVDVSDGPWSKEHALDIVKEANDGAGKEELEASRDLLLEIREIFCKFILKPCARTSYTRVAFQNPDNNNIRLTIDRDITVVEEMQAFNAKRQSNITSWCIEDSDVVPIEAFKKVPYGVFEVKVSVGESPLFVEELIASEAIVVAPKFSKFLTGASLHNFDRVSDITLPWWTKDAHFAPMYKMRSERSRKFSMMADGLTFSTKAIIDLVGGEKQELQKVDGNTATLNDIEEGRGGLSGSAPEKSSRTPNSQSSEDAGLFARFTGLRNRKNEKERTTAPRSPARVEPKSFYANERTFIQWVTNATLFMAVAEFIYAAGRNAGPATASRFVAVANGVVVCAILIAIYGTYMYYRRLNLMINAKPYGYSDSVGPGIFFTFIVVLLCMFMYVNNLGVETSEHIVHTTGSCVKRTPDLGASSGIPYLQFEPSAVVVEKERNIIIVGSLDEIIALPAGLPTDQASIDAPIQLLHRFADGTEDIEALHIVDGSIYALSEGKTDPTSAAPESDVIALDWTVNNTLIESGRWRIKSPYAEGMAYVNDPNWFSAPTLLVASDLSVTTATSSRLELNGFSVPFPVSEKLKKRKVNNKLFTQGLVDQKVAEMQYFGGLLYFLYNNDRRIRAFDPNGIMVNEWFLPYSTVGFENQWEGMELEQSGDELYLHLAQDSPPEIWTIKLEGETSPESAGTGQWRFPNCAS